MPRVSRSNGNKSQEIIHMPVSIPPSASKQNDTKRLSEETPEDSQLRDETTCNSKTQDMQRKMGEIVKQSSGDMVHCTTTMLSMYAMQQKGLLCDFLIIILPSPYNMLEKTVTYEVHQLVFMTRSKRIQDLTKPMIKLGGNVTCEGVERVIEYVYTGLIANIKDLSFESLTHISRAALALTIQIDDYIKKHRPDFVLAFTKIYVGHLRVDEKNSNKPVVTISKSTPSGQLTPLECYDLDRPPLEDLSEKDMKRAKEKKEKQTPKQKASQEEKSKLFNREHRKRKREKSSPICNTRNLTTENSKLQKTGSKPETSTTFAKDKVVTNEAVQNKNIPNSDIENADDLETAAQHGSTTNEASRTRDNSDTNSSNCDVIVDPFQHFS